MSQEIGSSLPPPLRFDFGAPSPPGQAGSALLLVTCDADGTPRVAVLANEEVRALDEGSLRLALRADSASCANCALRPHVSLWCVLDGAAYSIRGAVEPSQEQTRQGYQALDLRIRSVLRDFEPAAPMLAGPKYRRLD